MVAGEATSVVVTVVDAVVAAVVVSPRFSFLVSIDGIGLRWLCFRTMRVLRFCAPRIANEVFDLRFPPKFAISCASPPACYFAVFSRLNISDDIC